MKDELEDCDTAVWQYYWEQENGKGEGVHALAAAMVERHEPMTIHWVHRRISVPRTSEHY